jgi:ankyrin repeat protein
MHQIIYLEFSCKINTTEALSQQLDMDFSNPDLLRAARYGEIEWMKELLAKGADITERDVNGWGVLLHAGYEGEYTAMMWLLTEAGVNIAEVGYQADATVWNNTNICSEPNDPGGLSALLKVMVMLDDAPADFIARLSPHHAELCTRGRELQAQLPTYLDQLSATIIAHCPLPDVLQSIVVTYAATALEDMWMDGLPI